MLVGDANNDVVKAGGDMNVSVVIYFYYPLFISSSFCIICFCHNDLNSKYEIPDPKFTRLTVIETPLIRNVGFQPGILFIIS